MRAKQFLLQLIMCLLLLTSCTTEKVVTGNDPHLSVVGKRFVLREDCYTFHFTDSPKQLRLGSPRYDEDLRNALDKKLYPRGYASIVPNERVPKGSVFTIKKVIRVQTIEGGYFMYLTVLEREFRKDTNLVDVSFIMKAMAEPPAVDERIATAQEPINR